MRYSVALASHVGAVRHENQDAALALTLDLAGSSGPMRAVLAAVADGVGGLAAGAIASRTALGALAAHVTAGIAGVAAQPDPMAALSRLLHQGVLHAGRAVGAQEQSREAEMGTTLVAGLVVDDRLLLANVGDSRAYLIHGGSQQLTRDHTWVGDLLERGLISPEEAPDHPRRHLVTRVLGASRTPEPDMFELDLQPGDLLLFCSDGLSGVVPEAEMVALLEPAPAPSASNALGSETAGRPPAGNLQAAAQALVDRAVALGAPDNVSVVLVRLEEES
jgi:serine/threonine protein phosphatase PrpC